MSAVEFWSVVIAGALGLVGPVLVAGLGEIFLERTGGFNVGIEGMMLMGAAVGVLGSHAGGVWLGLLAGVAAGAAFGLLLGAVTAFGGADVVIAGIAIGLLGGGLSTFIYQLVNPAGSTNRTAPVQPPFHLGWLDAIPVIGPALAGAGLFFYLSLLLVPLTAVVLHWTRFGLRLRAVGDDPGVAATRGIDVRGFRLVAAVIAGAFAGLGGALVPLSSIGTFSPGITGGSGFIALAVVIIGRRTPLGLLGGAALFAVFNSLALLAQTSTLGVPVELTQALPYLVTLVVLCVVSRQLWLRARRGPRRARIPRDRIQPEPQIGAPQ